MIEKCLQKRKKLGKIGLPRSIPCALVGKAAHPAPPRLPRILTRNLKNRYLNRIHRVIHLSRLPAIVRDRARVRAQMRALARALALAHAHVHARVSEFPRALLASPGPTRLKEYLQPRIKTAQNGPAI